MDLKPQNKLPPFNPVRCTVITERLSQDQGMFMGRKHFLRREQQAGGSVFKPERFLSVIKSQWPEICTSLGAVTVGDSYGPRPHRSSAYSKAIGGGIPNAELSSVGGGELTGSGLCAHPIKMD